MDMLPVHSMTIWDIEKWNHRHWTFLVQIQIWMLLVTLQFFLIVSVNAYVNTCANLFPSCSWMYLFTPPSHYQQHDRNLCLKASSKTRLLQKQLISTANTMMINLTPLPSPHKLSFQTKTCLYSEHYWLQERQLIWYWQGVFLIFAI